MYQVPELSDSLSSLQQLLQSRVSTFSKLCELQGKLELVLTQAEADDDGLSATQQALTTPLAIVTVGGKLHPPIHPPSSLCVCCVAEEDEEDDIEVSGAGHEEELIRCCYIGLDLQ